MAQRVDLLLYNKIDNEKLKEHIKRYGQEWFRRSRSMSADWPLVSLAELYEIRSGLSKPAKDFGTGFPFLSFKDVFFNFFVPDRLTELVQANKRERESCSIKRGDVFLTRTSETIDELGMSCVALKDYEQATFNGFTKRLRPKIGNDLVPEYVGYYLRSPSFRKEMMAFSTLMSTRASLNNEMISRLKVLVPPRENQEVIAHILKSLDDKIELNRQINQTLEEMAQAIFKSWFVDFDPVKAKIEAKANGQDPERAAMCAISGKTDAELNGLSPEQLIQLRKTSALFPDELTGSELGLIPKGWKAGKIGDIATASGGYAFKSKLFIEKGHPVVKIKNIVGDGSVNLDESQCINDEQGQATSRFELMDGDLLMAMTGATVGKVGIVVLSGKIAYLNQRVAKFESTEFGPGISWFLFCAFQRENFLEQVIGTAQGSAQPNISSKGIESTKMILPSKKCLCEFIGKVDSLFLKWMNNQNEIKYLASTRDTLLPKLLTGKIKLKSAPISS
jgi:type I restriction enzyme, S subunit